MSNIQIPGPQYGLNEIIDAFTSESIEKRSKEGFKYNPLRPSSAGKCTKELGYEFMEYRGLAEYKKENKSPSVHRLLNLGNPIERHVIDEIYYAFKQSSKKISIKYKQQTLSFYKLPDGTFMEGSMDLGIEADDWKMVVDVKSKNDKYSQFHKSSWDEFSEKLTSTGHAVKFGDNAIFITDLEKFIDSEADVFFNNNLYQLNKYACSDFLIERGYTLASILQYNKNDSRLREVRFVPNRAVYERVKDKFTKVMEEVDINKSVENLPKDYALGSMKCGFCDFKKQCWPENDALKDYFAQLPKKQWPRDLDRLPAAVQAELVPLFDEYHMLSTLPEKLEKIEEKIVSTLYKNQVFKIRLNQDQIYMVKRLKSGGKGDGERMVLRRGKL